MSLQLGHDEEFNDGLKRLVVLQCQVAIDAIDRAGNDEERHAAVHDIRKALKKVRACLRLVRDQIDDYRDLNAYFRDLARPVSDIRDATANLETLDKLRARYAGTLRDDAFSSIRDGLVAHRAVLAERDFRGDDKLGFIRRELSAKLAEIPGWPWHVADFEDLRPGIERVYRRGCRGLMRSRNGGSLHDFHQWRKRVKYLRYQIDVLNRLWPEYMTTLEDEYHRLSDDIGELHDLDVLAQSVEALGIECPVADHSRLFRTLLEERQRQLAESALLQGSRCYLASPREFSDALEGYWRTWEQALQSTS